MDDKIITENNLEEIMKAKTKLREVFDIKYLRLLKFF
jgi:hypothetical protein